MTETDSTLEKAALKNWQLDPLGLWNRVTARIWQVHCTTNCRQQNWFPHHTLHFIAVGRCKLVKGAEGLLSYMLTIDLGPPITYSFLKDFLGINLEMTVRCWLYSDLSLTFPALFLVSPSLSRNIDNAPSWREHMQPQKYEGHTGLPHLVLYLLGAGTLLQTHRRPATRHTLRRRACQCGGASGPPPPPPPPPPRAPISPRTSQLRPDGSPWAVGSLKKKEGNISYFCQQQQRRRQQKLLPSVLTQAGLWKVLPVRFFRQASSRPEGCCCSRPAGSTEISRAQTGTAGWVGKSIPWYWLPKIQELSFFKQFFLINTFPIETWAFKARYLPVNPVEIGS